MTVATGDKRRGYMPCIEVSWLVVCEEDGIYILIIVCFMCGGGGVRRRRRRRRRRCVGLSA
jgi:hypothetical protein